jgi:tetratricopeptide (TPR) repeat protein
MWAVFAVLFLAYAGLLSFAARKNAPFLGSKLVQVLAIGGFFGLLYPVAQAVGPLLIMPVAFAGFALGVPFLTFLIGDWFDAAARAVTGVGSMKLRPTWDAAEKAEREGRLDDALALYREAASLHPGDPEPPRRVGELLLSKGEVPAALEAFAAALAGIAEPEPYATLAFRVADLEAREGRRDDARRRLDEVARRFPGTRFEAYARERLEA